MQSIVIEIQRQSADLYKVQLCNRQFFVGVPAIYVVKVYVASVTRTRLIVFLMNVPLGSPCVYVDMQLEMKPGTKKKKKIVRNKAIPSKAREPAALSIYAPLRCFHLVVLFKYCFVI